MATRNRALLTTVSSLIFVLAGMFLINNVALGSTPALYDTGTATCTTDSEGFCNGPTLPFQPNAVTITVQTPTTGPSQAMARITTSSFRARFFHPSGSKAASMAVTYSYAATRASVVTPTATTTTATTATATTATATATTPTATTTSGSSPRTPSQILNLSNWYLTLPIGSSSATMVMQPQLNSYTSQYFFTNASNDGVVLRAPVSGTTTSGSTHTRSELRETAPNGTLPWGWSAGSGTHILTATQAITHLPGGNGTLGFAQIHGAGSIWYLILDAVGTGNGTAKLVVKDKSGKANGAVIDPSYRIGTKFNLTVSAVKGVISIDYNGVRKVTTSSTLTGSYFKIGAYNQSAGDFGEAVVYGVSVTHR